MRPSHIAPYTRARKRRPASHGVSWRLMASYGVLWRLVARHRAHAQPSRESALNRAPPCACPPPSDAAAASVNHFHMHVIDEKTPLFEFGLERAPRDVDDTPCYRLVGHPAAHYVLPWKDLQVIWRLIAQMQAANMPHNLAFSATHAYIFPRDDAGAAHTRPMLPGEVVGAPRSYRTRGRVWPLTAAHRPPYRMLTPPSARAPSS